MTAVGSCSQLTDCNLLSFHVNTLLPSSSSPQTRQLVRRAFRPTVPSTLSSTCPTRPTQTVVALSAAGALLFVRSLSVAFLSCSPCLSLCSQGFMTALHLCRVRAQQKQKKAHSRERPTVHCCCKSLLCVPFALRPHSLYYSTSICVRHTTIYAFVFNVPFHICHSLFIKNLKIRRQHHFSPFEYLFYFKKPGRTPPRTWRPSSIIHSSLHDHPIPSRHFSFQAIPFPKARLQQSRTDT